MKALAWWRGTVRVSLLLGILGSALLWGGCKVYLSAIPQVLARMNVSVGEVLKDRGIRQERAGETTLAMGSYELALEAAFNGPEHRAEAEEHLGRLYLSHGQACWALRLLEKAGIGPDARSTALSAWCEALVAAGKPEVALALLYERNTDSGLMSQWVIAYWNMLLWEQNVLFNDFEVNGGAARLLAAGRTDEAMRTLLPYIAVGAGRSVGQARWLWENLRQQDSCDILKALKQMRRNS